MVYNTKGRISSADINNAYDGIKNLTKDSDRFVGNNKPDVDNLNNAITSSGSKSLDRVVSNDESDMDHHERH